MTLFSSVTRFFQRFAHSFAGGLIVVLMLSHASLAVSNVVSPSHDPLRAMTHAHNLAGADADQDAHDHSHEEHDAGGMHQHGHNPADHSHDKPNLPPALTVAMLLLSNRWNADEHRLVYPSPCSSLERPPKSLSMM
jgi:hypothetical protein